MSVCFGFVPKKEHVEFFIAQRGFMKIMLNLHFGMSE